MRFRERRFQFCQLLLRNNRESCEWRRLGRKFRDKKDSGTDIVALEAKDAPTNDSSSARMAKSADFADTNLRKGGPVSPSSRCWTTGCGGCVSDVGTGGAGIRLQLFKSSFRTCKARRRAVRYAREEAAGEISEPKQEPLYFRR